MTRDRRRKQDLRARQGTGSQDRTYARTRRAEAIRSQLESIRTYPGAIGICSACGQPAHATASGGPRHFTEQAGAVFCPAYPAAAGLIAMAWEEFSLTRVRQRYPWPVTTTADCAHHSERDRFRDYTGQVTVCSACGQPAYWAEEPGYWAGHRHFTDQWDGVHCPRHPLASRVIDVAFHPRSLADWKTRYTCTYPHRSATRHLAWPDRFPLA
ncbi:hypothetical protein PJ985_17960 [Streptomyces sp. ACA25]|uniref:hypothetical protein n=1 Tax=Streptomyces sp. ACA25 TaxID=3022596 RepID=UPI0023073B8D|nr:hypothetical protein [Streptomyces sp. ACA25]MDB1089448.1 hypothetical protein [Streptomyces sp. ACA25]